MKHDVIALARQTPPTTPVWLKYNSVTGNFDENGITGLGSPINISPKVDMHADAAYCNILKQYLLLGYDDVTGHLYLFRSSDGLAWSSPQAIASSYVDIDSGLLHKPVYPYFASLNSDASTDCSIVGRQFYIFTSLNILLIH